MKKIIALLIILTALIATNPLVVFAGLSDNGFEGGISSGYVTGEENFEYKEVIFVTGRPIVLEGTVIIKKTLRDDEVRSTYTYNLENPGENATLRRVLNYSTSLTGSDNGQTLEQTLFSRDPFETIEIDGVSYVLQDYDFSRSNIIDSKPAVDYFAGNTSGKKTYRVGNNASDNRLIVEIEGNFFGCKQYWGTAESAACSLWIQYTGSDDSWGGTASIKFSSTTSKSMEYVDNMPKQISFNGGYIERQHNRSIMKYDCKLPEFDSDGISTDHMIEKSGSLNLETFPVQKRLPVPDLSHIRGHWAERDAGILFSLGVLHGEETLFEPEQVMTRVEFTNSMVMAAREVPQDPRLEKRKSRNPSRRNLEQDRISPFKDISVDHIFFPNIESAYNRGLIKDMGSGSFGPDETVTMSDAITMFIRALGLENMGPGTYAVTTFRDNDKIPSYARNSVYVAQKIGLVKGDARGYLRPGENLTKARAAAMLNRFLRYMRTGMLDDYTGIMNY